MKRFFKPQKEGANVSHIEARGSFNEMYAMYIRAARQWKMAAAGSLAVAIISSGGLVAVSLQHKVVPYAVEFNEHAEAVRVTRVGEMAQPTDNQIRAALRTWIVDSRTVYVDRRAQENLFKTAYAMTLPGSAAYKALYAYHTANNPYEIAEKATIAVVVNSIRPISDRTWLIEWTETTNERSGRVIDSRVWQGSVTVAIVPPTDEGQIFVNPVGMYVENYSWGARQ